MMDYLPLIRNKFFNVNYGGSVLYHDIRNWPDTAYNISIVCCLMAIVRLTKFLGALSLQWLKRPMFSNCVKRVFACSNPCV